MTEKGMPIVGEDTQQLLDIAEDGRVISVFQHLNSQEGTKKLMRGLADK